MAVREARFAFGGGSGDLQLTGGTPSREATSTTTTTVAVAALAAGVNSANDAAQVKRNNEREFDAPLPYESVHLAARLGDVEYVTAQIRDGGVDPNSLSDEGLPLLHAAIEGGSKDVIAQILSRHPDLSITFQPAQALPPLDPYAYAVYLGAVDALDQLMDNDASSATLRLDPIGNWLHLTLRFMRYEMISHLRHAYPERFAQMMQEKDNQKRLPEQLATELGDREALRALLGEKKGRELVLPREAPTPFNPSIVEFNGGVGAGAMAFVGAIQVLEEQNALGSVETFVGSSMGVIPAALAALGRSSQEMQYWISQFPLDQILDERPDRKAAFEPVKFLPDSAKKQPTAYIEQLNSSPFLCKGTVLKSVIELMIERVTSQKNFTLGDLSKQVNAGDSKYHLIVPIRTENGQVEIIRSDDEKYAAVTLNSLIHAALATPGLYPPVNILATRNGNEEVFLSSCSDPSLARCKPTSFTCSDALPYLKRGILCFSLSSSAQPLDCPSSQDTSVQEYALYLVSIHHMMRRLHTPPQKRQRAGQVIIDTRGHGIASNPTLFINAGRTPTQKHFRSRQCALPPLFFTPYQRPALTKAIEERVLFAGNESFKDARRLTIFQSPSGMGKSTLVHIVISGFREHFSDLLVVDYATPSTTYVSLRAMAESLDLFVEPYENSSVIEKKIKRLLEEHSPNKPWLLLCENCRELPNELLPQSGGSIICCVTRKPDEAPIDNALLVPPLELPEALKLLAKETQAIGEMGDLTRLAKRLDNHPQALMQAALYIKEHAIPVAAYLALLGDQGEEIDPTSETVRVALNHFRENTPHSASCLAVFARLAPDAIPEKWVEQWLAGLDDTHHPTSSYEILTHLERCGLITYHPEHQQFSIQRKARFAIQMSTTEEGERIAELIQLMLRIKSDFRLDDPSTWPFGRTWAIHAQFLMDATQQMGIDPLQKGTIYQALGEINLRTGEAERAIEAFQQAKDLFLQARTSEKLRAHVLAGLGSAALERLNLDLAEKSFQEGLTLTRNDQYLEPYCSLQCGLGDIYFARGNYGAAREAYGVVVQKNQSQIPTNQSLSYPRARLGWGETFLQGDNPAVVPANQILEESEELFRQRYGDAPHPDVGRRYLLLAHVHDQQGELKQAEASAKKALSIYRTLYPRETHPQIALAYDHLAGLYLTNGYLRKALKKSHQALGIINYICPEVYHPIKIHLLERHASILERLRRYEEACNVLIERAALLDQQAEPRVMENRSVKSKAEELYRTHAYREAIPFFRAISTLYLYYDPTAPAQTFNLVAKEAFDAKQYAVSIQLREDALAIDRQEPQQPSTDFTALLHARIGLAYTHLEDYPNAHTHLEFAVGIYSDLYPYATEIAASPYGLAKKAHVTPLDKVGHLLATVQLYKESAAIYETNHLTEESAIENALLFAPALRALAERYYNEKNFLTAAHHWQSLTAFLTENQGTHKEIAYAYYRLASSQQKGGKKESVEASAAIAQEKWEELLQQIPDPTPLDQREERATLLINLGKTQYLRWKYRAAAASFQQADALLEQLTEQNANPSKAEEWQELRTFLAEKIRANSSPLKRPIDYS